MRSGCFNHLPNSIHSLTIQPSFSQFVHGQLGRFQLVIVALGAGVVNGVVEPDGCFYCVRVEEVVPMLIKEVEKRVDVIEGVVVAGWLGVEGGEFGDHDWGEKRHFVVVS